METTLLNSIQAKPQLLDDTAQFELVQNTVESFRPFVQKDGGDLELVKIVGDRVFIKLSGSCTTCTHAGQTLGSVRRKLVEVLGIPVRVVPAV